MPLGPLAIRLRQAPPCLRALLAGLFVLLAGAADGASIPWHAGSFQSALRQARKQDQPVFLYFWMEGSQHCQNLYQETLTSAPGVAEVADFVCFSAQATEATSRELVSRFGVSTLPTILILTHEGQAEDAIPGYIGQAGFVAEMQRIRSGQGTVSSLRAQVLAAPEDLALRFQLSTKLTHVGQTEESQALIDSIKRDDPKGASVVGAQLHMYAARQACFDDLDDPSNLQELDLRPLVRHMSRVQPTPVQFEGWDWIARTELSRGKRKDARKAFARAWPHVPAAQRIQFGTELVLNYWEMRTELERKDRTLLVEVATRCAAEAATTLESPTPDLPPLPDGESLESEFEGTPEEFVAFQLTLLARAYFMNGKKAQALEALDRAQELDPGSTDIASLRPQLAAE